MADWTTGYDPLNMSDPSHPFARLGAELARAQQQGMGQRRSLAEQLGGYPQQMGMPQQPSRLASMLGQPQQQQIPMQPMQQALTALMGQQSKFGSGASASAPVQNWDPAKPNPSGMQSSGFGGWLQGLFGSGGAGGAAKG